MFALVCGGGGEEEGVRLLVGGGGGERGYIFVDVWGLVFKAHLYVLGCLQTCVGKNDSGVPCVRAHTVLFLRQAACCCCRP